LHVDDAVQVSYGWFCAVMVTNACDVVSWGQGSTTANALAEARPQPATLISIVSQRMILWISVLSTVPGIKGKNCTYTYLLPTS
jgi:hypothetical protein